MNAATRQVIRITAGLTVSCVIAGTLMGAVYTVTAKPKERNAEAATRETMLRLLGYGGGRTAPAGLEFRTAWRYVVDATGAGTYSAYVVPLAGSAAGAAAAHEAAGFVLVPVDLDGTPRGEPRPLDLAPEASADPRAREAAVRAAVGTAAVRYGDEIVVAREDGRRIAWLLPGEFQGFKTRIRVILALDPGYRIVGLEIMEHEEDPGLGAEITRGYFKNQFRGKSFERLRTIAVVKEPLPDDYRGALEPRGDMSAADLASIEEKFQSSDIHAITGATISSQSVTDGVRGMATRFASRVEVLDGALAAGHVAAAF